MVQKNPQRRDEAFHMNGCAIIKMESDAMAAKEDIVSEFNGYLQRNTPTVSFVQNGVGYFRLCSEQSSPVGILAFGNFLLTTGFVISGIGGATTKKGEGGTSVCFTKGGKSGCVVLYQAMETETQVAGHRDGI